MRVTIIENDDFSFWQFHRGLAESLIAAGAEVCSITPPGPFVARIEALGIRHISLSMKRFVDPMADIAMLCRLVRILRELRPGIVHTITVKPNIFGVLAAAICGVPRIVSQVPGLGYAFDRRTGFRWRAVRRIVMLLYRLAFRSVDRVWFLNAQDLTTFTDNRLLRPEKAVVIRSVGVSLIEYSPAAPDFTDSALRAELGVSPGWKVVLMGGRLIWSKGIREYVEASRIVAGELANVIFLLAGQLDPGSPDPVPEAYLRESESPHFRYLGFRMDIPRLLRTADLVVLPSYYREGVPRILLEAIATGKAVIAADNPGSKEVVAHGHNGFLVPPRDAHALAGAIQTLLSDDSTRAAFGAHSLQMAGEFDVARVIPSIIELLYQITSATPGNSVPAGNRTPETGPPAYAKAIENSAQPD